MKIDQYGLIVQQNGDQGDCAARSGQYYSVVNSISGLMHVCSNLEKSGGLWIRHPQYPDVKDFSRDQTDPIIIMLGVNDLKPWLDSLFKAHIKRGFFYQNKDWPMFSTPGLYIRAFKAWYLYPLLLILDLGFLLIFLQNLANHNPDDVDDNNCVMRFTQAVLKYPTPWSYLGRKLYAWTRPKNLGNSFGEKNNVMAALMWYHRAAAPSFGNPEIAEAYRPIIEKYF